MPFRVIIDPETSDNITVSEVEEMFRTSSKRPNKNRLSRSKPRGKTISAKRYRKKPLRSRLTTL